MHKIFFFYILFFLVSSAINSEEIKHKDFTITYEDPALKYYASIFKDHIVKGMVQIESISGLKFKQKILVNLYKSTDAFLNQKKIQSADDILLRYDSATSISFVITPNIGYYSNLPFSIIVQKKLFFVLFRQNKLPENVWFEEAFFELALHEINTFGVISISELKTHFSSKNNFIEDFKKQEWETARDIPNTPENIKLSIDKINAAKTLLLYQRTEEFDKDPLKITKYCQYYIKQLEKKIPWIKSIQFIPNEDFIKKNTLKRDLYAKMMENFNAPSSGATQNISQEYVFRSILRLLIKKQTDQAYKLFKELEISPTKSPYFPELGLFFAKKYKTDQIMWLEYFLLNQTEKKPVDFDVPDQVSILLQETLSQEMPDFQVADQDLDFIRTLQFLLYIGKNELLLEFLEQDKEPPQNIEIKNLIWGIGLLLNNKKIIKNYDENIEFFKLRTWDVIKAIR